MIAIHALKNVIFTDDVRLIPMCKTRKNTTFCYDITVTLYVCNTIKQNTVLVIWTVELFPE